MPPKNFTINFSKPDYFIICFGNTADLKFLQIGYNYFGLYLRGQIFSKYGFELEHSKKYKLSLRNKSTKKEW